MKGILSGRCEMQISNIQRIDFFKKILKLKTKGKPNYPVVANYEIVRFKLFHFLIFNKGTQLLLLYFVTDIIIFILLKKLKNLLIFYKILLS